MKEYTLKNDYLFKEVFSKKGNEYLLKDFLSEIMQENITKVEVKKDVELAKTSDMEKYGVLDLKVVIDNSKIINVEMQRINVGDIGKRTLYYGSKLVSSQLIKGEKYDKLKPVVVITILDYEIYKKHNNYITKSYIMSEKHKESIREDGITFYDIELPKMRKYIKENTERNNLLDWLIFIDNKNKEEVNMAVGRSAVIAKAKEECEYLTGEKAERRKAELIEKKRKDMASAVGYGIDVGMKRGLAKGLQQGLQQGIEQTAEKMLKNKMNIKMIIDITGLSKEKIENISKRIKCD